MSRDWLATLWPASYCGVPFFVERDEVEGGRRVKEHEFPHRDDTFNEDMGDGPRHYAVTAYLHGDDCDAQADALVAVLSQNMAGSLVLPDQGPLYARAIKPWKRARDRDRMGVVRVDARFVRETLSVTAPSATYLLQLAYDAVDAFAGTVASVGSAAVDLLGQPSWVVADAGDALQGTVAALEEIRASGNVDAAEAGKLAAAFTADYAAAGSAATPLAGIDATIVAQIVTDARALAAAMPAPAAIAAFGAALDAVPPAAPAIATTPTALLRAQNAAALARLETLVLLTAYVDAVLAAPYASRPDALAARTALVATIGAALDGATGARNLDLMTALLALRARAVDYLAARATNLAPLLTVTTGVPLPSLVLAWTLYGDPTRAPELVARNAVPHPSFMPERLSALAT